MSKQLLLGAALVISIMGAALAITAVSNQLQDSERKTCYEKYSDPAYHKTTCMNYSKYREDFMILIANNEPISTNAISSITNLTYNEAETVLLQLEEERLIYKEPATPGYGKWHLLETRNEAGTARRQKPQ